MPTSKRGRGLDVHPVTPDRWNDLAALFGPKGACAGCWCMFFRHTGREHWALGNEGNRRAMRNIVGRHEAPGLLAYADGAPIGWVSVAPREEYPRIVRSPVTRPVDDRPAWAVVCFFLSPEARGKGVAQALLAAAVDHARANGARIVEGYPHDTDVAPVNADDAYVGLLRWFHEAGFREVARRSRSRPVVRRSVRPRRSEG